MTIRNLNLVESVYGTLLERLRFSDVAPDERLVDTEIAASYGTSRMPAREALLRLVAEGYLVGTTRGFMVRELSTEDVTELFELRRQLEPRAIAAATRDLTEAGASAIAEAMSAIRDAAASGDLARLVRANVAFRDSWVACVSNRRLADTIGRFMDYFQAIRLATFAEPATRRAYVDSLGAVHDAIMARDPLKAADRLLAFLFVAEDAYLTALQARSMAEPQAIRKSRSRKSRES